MAGDDLTAGVYVGVDSGGTLTNVSVLAIDESGDQRSSNYEVSEALSGALSPRLIPNVLSKIFAPLDMTIDDLAADGLTCYAWVSAAGFTPWTRDDFVKALHDLAPTVGNGQLRSVGAANDAVTLLLGLRAGGVVIAGTGSNVIMKSLDGSLHQTGGHEWVACDYGSGFWIGLHAIRRAYRDFEAGVDSVLLQRIRQVYGIRSDDDEALMAKMRNLAIGDRSTKKEIARPTASVCAAAERGDRSAQDIVNAEAEDLADVTALSIRRSFTRDQLMAGLRIVQCGSLLGNSFYRKSFESRIEMRLLSGTTRRAQIEWHRVATGGDAAVQLARDVEAGSASDLLRLDLAFRPAIVDT